MPRPSATQFVWMVGRFPNTLLHLSTVTFYKIITCIFWTKLAERNGWKYPKVKKLRSAFAIGIRKMP